MFAIICGTLIMATVALLEPARAVRARLREEKQRELARVRQRIHAARAIALGSAEGAGGARDLPGLLAYEARIEAVPEWPFDTSTLVRFGGLLVLAVGSWLGGALVERLVGSVLE